MRHRSKTESVNPEQSTRQVIAPGIKALRVLSVVAVALFVFVGAAHAQGPCPPSTPNCILVSDNNGVTVWSDDGRTELNSQLTSDGGGGEGISCISGSTNVLYVADGGSSIKAYSMNLVGTHAPLLNSVAACSSNTTGLAANGSGMLLYEASYGNPGCVSSMTPLPAFPWLVLNSGQNTIDNYSHDVALGICAPGTSCGYGGNVFTSYFSHSIAGVNEYTPNPNLNAQLPFVGQFLPAYPNNCAYFTPIGTRCWTYLSGMAFDNLGNLWVNSAGNPNGTFEFAPGGSCGSPVCPLNFVPDLKVSGEPIGLTVAPSTDPDNPGKILLANYQTADVEIIDPSTCTGLHPSGSPWTPGTCSESTFISDRHGHPKYVVYNQGCANPDNNGYIEICKQGDPNYPPPNQLYDFTVTAPQFSTGTIQVPLGECSGPIQVPSATAPNSDTITEAPVIGVLVDNVTAIAYDNLGFKINQLDSWVEPDLNASVYVQPGDQSLETLATFTNYAAPPGTLKVCKIAGSNNLLGTLFNFTATGLPNFQVEAGPPDQGGYCAVVSTSLPANTAETITEVTIPSGVSVSNITVTCNACIYTVNLAQSSVLTTIGSGITEVTFTNIQSKPIRCLACNR